MLIPLKPYVSLLRVVDVSIDGTTRPFLFDTGGGMTLVTPEFAKEIGCAPFGRLTGFRSDGGRIDAPRCDPASLTIGAFHTRADDLGVFDLMSLLEGFPEIGGLVGLSAFEKHILTIELAANRITIETPESATKRVRTMQEIRVRPSHQAGGASLDLFVSIDTPRGPIWLELDSGNIGSVLLSPHAIEQLGIELPESGSKETELTISGYGPVRVNASARDTTYDGLLDARFMQGVVITIDLAQMRAWMAPREPETSRQ